MGIHLVIDPREPLAGGSIAESWDLVSSTVSTLRSTVMRRVVAREQLECVCPWQLAPSEPRNTAGTSVTAGREGRVAPPPPMRAHSLASLTSTGTRPSWVMQAPFLRARKGARPKLSASAVSLRSRFQPILAQHTDLPKSAASRGRRPRQSQAVSPIGSDQRTALAPRLAPTSAGIET